MAVVCEFEVVEETFETKVTIRILETSPFLAMFGIQIHYSHLCAILHFLSLFDASCELKAKKHAKSVVNQCCSTLYQKIMIMFT